MSRLCVLLFHRGVVALPLELVCVHQMSWSVIGNERVCVFASRTPSRGQLDTCEHDSFKQILHNRSCGECAYHDDSLTNTHTCSCLFGEGSNTRAVPSIREKFQESPYLCQGKCSSTLKCPTQTVPTTSSAPSCGDPER